MQWLRRMFSREFDQYSSDDNYNWEIQIARFAFGTTGVWPEAGKNDRMRFYISLTIIIVFLSLPQIIKVFSLEDDIQLFVGISFTMYLNYLKVSTIFLRFNSRARQSILEEMQENWRNNSSEEDKEIMHQYAGRSRKIGMILFALRSFTLIVAVLDPLLKAVVRRQELSMALNALSHPFSLSNTFVFASCYIFSLIALGILSLSAIGIDVFLINFSFHTCAQLVKLGNRIRMYESKMRHSSEEEISNDCSCLKCIVDHHVRICEFVKEFNNYYHMLIFMRLFATVTNFCCYGFEIMKAIKTRNFAELMTCMVFMLVLFVQWLLSCWLAEMCQKRSYALGDIAYSTKWMTKDPKISRNLIMIIRQSRIPLKITAARYFVLSLNFFREFVSTSISYLSVLITVKLGK